MKKVVLLALLMAAIVPSLSMASSSGQYRLSLVPVIELGEIVGPGSPFTEAEIREAVVKSGKAVVAVSGRAYNEVVNTQDRVLKSARYACDTQNWAAPEQMIAPTNHFHITGRAEYVENQDLRRSIGAAVLSAALNPRDGCNNYFGRNRSVGIVRANTYGGGSGEVSWKKKTATVVLVLESPSTATGIYDKHGAVKGTGKAGYEDINIGYLTRYGNQYDNEGIAQQLFNRATDEAVKQIVSGLPEPEEIGPITVRSGKSLVAGKSQVAFYRNDIQIAKYQVLAVDGKEVAVWPLSEKSRPIQGDQFNIE